MIFQRETLVFWLIICITTIVLMVAASTWKPTGECLEWREFKKVVPLGNAPRGNLEVMADVKECIRFRD